MSSGCSRRGFMGLLGAGMILSLAARGTAAASGSFRVRTITAGIDLRNAGDLDGLDRALEFLAGARQAFTAHGYTVQTVRIATPPLATYLPDWQSATAMKFLRALDERAVKADMPLSIGPVITGDEYREDFASWAAQLVQYTRNLSFSVAVASPEKGVHYQAVRAAAEAIAAIAAATPGGEGNFRFAAAACCRAGTPFFPAAFHAGEAAFSIGLESPPLLQAALEGGRDLAGARHVLKDRIDKALAPVEKLAREITGNGGWRYLGIDTSPAPGLDASIGQVIETMTGAPFGSPSTLAACAAITGALKDLSVRSCGYSGLMLPVMEDPVLAQRAAEQRFRVSELLLYSSVCGTGLDVVPLPGDTGTAELAAAITDVAALSARYGKPLSARLLPAPGKRAGETVHFDNPHLTDAVAMTLD